MDHAQPEAAAWKRLDYYDSLLHNLSVSFAENGGSILPEGVEYDPDGRGSAVVRLTRFAADDSSKKETIRLVHMPKIFDYTSNGEIPYSFRLPSARATLLAIKHFNSRNNSIISDLNELLTKKINSTSEDNASIENKKCNIYITTELSDSGRNALISASQLERVIALRGFPYEPVAVLAAGLSSVSAPLARLNSIRKVPQVSSRATSSVLSNRVAYKYFGRLVPSVRGDAFAVMEYLSSLRRPNNGQSDPVVTHVGALYMAADAYSESYAFAAQDAAIQYNIQLEKVPFEGFALSDIPFLRQSLRKALTKLKETGYRYFLGVIFDHTLQYLVEEASKLGMMGTPEFVWLFTDSVFPGNIAEVARTLPGDIGNKPILHGIGLIGVSKATATGQFQRFEAALLEAEADEAFRDYFFQKSVSVARDTECYFCPKSDSPLFSSPLSQL